MDGKKRKVMFLIYSLCGGRRGAGAGGNSQPPPQRPLRRDAHDAFPRRYPRRDAVAGGALPPGAAREERQGAENPQRHHAVHHPAEMAVPLVLQERRGCGSRLHGGVPDKILAYSTNQHAKKYAWVHIDVQTYTKQDRLFRSMRHQKACYERFDGIYCVSENVQEAFSAKFGLTERVHVAYNIIG